jgi:uncharacterized protein YndB with AHSA1/START domain
MRRQWWALVSYLEAGKNLGPGEGGEFEIEPHDKHSCRQKMTCLFRDTVTDHIPVLYIEFTAHGRDVPLFSRCATTTAFKLEDCLHIQKGEIERLEARLLLTYTEGRDRSSEKFPLTALIGSKYLLR